MYSCFFFFEKTASRWQERTPDRFGLFLDYSQKRRPGITSSPVSLLAQPDPFFSLNPSASAAAVRPG